MPDYDVIIAGSGAAGLTAALFSARHGRSAVVLGFELGGALLSITSVDDFPGFPEGVGGFDLCPMLQEQSLTAGAEFQTTDLQRLEQADAHWAAATTDGAVITARAAIVATGTQLHSLGVPGEDRLTGHGVSQCASCDGPLYRGKTAVVVGGGDSALLEALELADVAEQVVVVERAGSLTGQSVYRDRIGQHPNVRVQLETVVVEVLGDERVSGVRLRDLATGVESTLDASGVFVFVGGGPRLGFLDGLPVTDAHGCVETDVQMRTGIPGLFAAGSVRSGFCGQAVAAAGDGAAAAVAAHRYLAASEPAPAEQ